MRQQEGSVSQKPANRARQLLPWFALVVSGLVIAFQLFKPTKALLSTFPLAEVKAHLTVSGKLKDFVRKQSAQIDELAQHDRVKVPAEIRQYFELAGNGRWDDAEKLYASLSQRQQSREPMEDFRPFWRPLQKISGAREVVRSWPAKALLDYGHFILTSLPPGAIYLAGSDPGYFIPLLLNETSTGENHPILSPNALSDESYLAHVRHLYGERLNLPNEQDAGKAFSDYVKDAVNRFHHDEQFPNEPRQLRPGESVEVTGDGRTNVGGAIAVMGINENMIKLLLLQNPKAVFALEESFSFTSFHSNAIPVGALIRLAPPLSPSHCTPEQATATVQYWKGIHHQLLSDASTSTASGILGTYARLASTQASVLQQQNFADAARRVYQLASELAPANVEITSNYSQLLVQLGQKAEAMAVAQKAIELDHHNPALKLLVRTLSANGDR